MALKIASVPVLTGEASDRFDEMMERSEEVRGSVDFSSEIDEARVASINPECEIYYLVQNSILYYLIMHKITYYIILFCKRGRKYTKYHAKTAYYNFHLPNIYTLLH